MARPKNPNKVEKEPLIVYEQSAPFFKAFIYPENDEDMIVDTSGDVFSHTIEDAIHEMISHVDQDTFNRMPNRLFQFSDGTPIASEDKDINPSLGDIVVLRLYCHDKDDFPNVTSDDDGENFIIRLKDVTHGYTTGLCDYRINRILLETDKKSTVPKFYLKELEAHVTDEERANPLFPVDIKI